MRFYETLQVSSVRLPVSTTWKKVTIWSVIGWQTTMLPDKQWLIICSPSGILHHTRKSYIGKNYVHLYNKAKSPLVPTHMKGGPWIWCVMTSSDLTAWLACTVTGHVPIGSYYDRFLSHKNLHLACPCGFPTGTVMQWICDCPDAVHSHPPKHKLCLAWFIKFLDANAGIFAFDVP
jgi:hypothetical protein